MDTLAILLSDTYKQVHHNMFPRGLTKLVSYWTPRRSMLKEQDHMVFFGLQAFIKEYLITYFKRDFFKLSTDEVQELYTISMDIQLGEGNYDISPILKLHELGYLPIQIRALPEGTLVPMGVPCIEITNTHPDFAWVVQWIECILQVELWKPCAHATIGHMYRELANFYYKKTCDDILRPEMACSDFGMRGMSCMEEAIRCSSAWLLSFDKTSTIPAIDYIDTYYDACCWIERIGIGAVSTEHSVMASNYAVDGDEITFVKRLLTELYPNASFSMVSDTYDYWNMIDNILPACKEEIMQHNGKLLVRPDSGDIVEIAVKTIEKLWNVFGGTVNSKGYKVLDPHIGIIYGDGCTLNNVKQVWEELKKKGFAANNIVFGVGAFCFSAIVEPDGHMVVVTRDMFGIAMKATYGIVNGEPIMIYKDPKTDVSHLKKSHKGCCRIYYDDNEELQCEDGYDEVFGDGTLRTVFVNGKIYNKETFEDIRERLNGETKMSKITDYLLKDDVIVVMDVDGVLAPYEFSELSHSMTDDEWDRLVASGENPYKDVRPIKLMQEFIQKKGVDKVYTCSKSPLSEIPGKKAFIKDNYNLPDDNIYFTLEKTEKLTVLQTLQQKLGLKPSQIAIVEDTVKTLDYIRAHSDFVTVHVSSFME